MNIVFMRHGEATDNVKEIISDREIYWSVLTEEGIKTVCDSLESLEASIDKIYVSPFPRTIETAHFAHEKYSDAQVIIENRLHEIDHGKYSGMKNNEDLDNVRNKQIAGDYFTRFGDYGENKYQIEERLSSFLNEVYNSNMDDNTIMIVSHGSITSYMKRLLSLKSPHIKTGKIEVFDNVDFNPLFKYMKKMTRIKNKEINSKKEIINSININDSLKKNLLKMYKTEFNNIEFYGDGFDNYLEGLKSNNLVKLNSSKFNDGVILICFYQNIENIASKWMEHYIKLGIKNFVLVDNCSSDNSNEILKSFSKDVNIDFWSFNEKYNCQKMCGLKQQLFEHYGKNKMYLTVDSDELFIYENYESVKLNEFINSNNLKSCKAIMLDTYSNKKLFTSNFDETIYVDKGTYRTDTTVPYGMRIYGGPRYRAFGIRPSLQKIPLIYYTGKEVYINDHYYYPWNINNDSILNSYLLHYKFMQGDLEKYTQYAKDERHWNNSREYKIYADNTKNKITFYDDNISILIDNISYKF